MVYNEVKLFSSYSSIILNNQMKTRSDNCLHEGFLRVECVFASLSTDTPPAPVRGRKQGRPPPALALTPFHNKLTVLQPFNGTVTGKCALHKLYL